MIESAIVFGLLLGLIVLGGAAVVFSPDVLLLAGLCAALVGSLVGLPSGFYYHVVLYRQLSANGPAPRKWWWHPTRYHRRLNESQWAQTRPWFWLGGLGFMLIVAGGLLTGLAVLVTMASGR